MTKQPIANVGTATGDSWELVESAPSPRPHFSKNFDVVTPQRASAVPFQASVVPCLPACGAASDRATRHVCQFGGACWLRREEQGTDPIFGSADAPSEKAVGSTWRRRALRI
jgi:hypothetical protein